MARKGKVANGTGRTISPKDRWRCAVCNTFKISSEFTEKELNKVIKDVNLDPANCFMTCQECIEEPAIYQCEGPCGEMKRASDFSKAARKNQTWKCMQCVSWDGLQEAYVPPLDIADLAEMTWGVDAATAVAGSYMDEPAGRPQDSDWDLAIAAAKSAAGRTTPDNSSAATFADTASSTVPLRRGLPYNAFDSSGKRHRGWKDPTGTPSPSQAPRPAVHRSESDWPSLDSSASPSAAASTSSQSSQGLWGRAMARKKSPRRS